MITVVYALVTHFVADFLLQRREVGKKKSSSPQHMLEHILIILICFLPFGFDFAAYNALLHLAIDATTWNVYKVVTKFRYPNDDSSFKYWEDHLFYTTIGFDQLLHTITIVILSGVLLQ